MRYWRDQTLEGHHPRRFSQSRRGPLSGGDVLEDLLGAQSLADIRGLSPQEKQMRFESEISDGRKPGGSHNFFPEHYVYSLYMIGSDRDDWFLYLAALVPPRIEIGYGHVYVEERISGKFKRMGDAILLLREGWMDVCKSGWIKETTLGGTTLEYRKSEIGNRLSMAAVLDTHFPHYDISLLD